QPATRSDITAVSELLHEDFEEIGRSGQYYDKRQTLAALKMETSQTVIFAEGFKLATIAEGTVLLTYRSFHRGAEGDVSRCTWLLSSKEGGRHWQMRFHQGTPTDD
ncbi:nuclear transport factor 2 family protein, partial [Corallococcus sicarius]